MKNCERNKGRIERDQVSIEEDSVLERFLALATLLR